MSKTTEIAARYAEMPYVISAVAVGNRIKVDYPRERGGRIYLTLPRAKAKIAAYDADQANRGDIQSRLMTERLVNTGGVEAAAAAAAADDLTIADPKETPMTAAPTSAATLAALANTIKASIEHHQAVMSDLIAVKPAVVNHRSDGRRVKYVRSEQTVDILTTLLALIDDGPA